MYHHTLYLLVDFFANVLLGIVLLVIAVISFLVVGVTVLQQLDKLRTKRNEKYNKAEGFIEVISSDSKNKAGELLKIARQTHCGLLSVGLKLHCSGKSAGLVKKLRTNSQPKAFKLQQADICIVLPPFGSADAAIQCLELLEQVTGTTIFNNPEIQIQVCTPGRLSNKHAALLGTAFYLGSDMLKRFGKESHRTTQPGYTCDRLVIYDYLGLLDTTFEWWGTMEGRLVLYDMLPFATERTDVLGCQTRTDIRNVNLVASLLVHAERDAFWGNLGKAFAEDMHTLLVRHELSGAVSALWIRQEKHINLQYTDDDMVYFERLSELMDYVFDEIGRIAAYRSKNKPDDMRSILFETKNLLAKYAAIVDSHKLNREVHNGSL